MLEALLGLFKPPITQVKPTPPLVSPPRKKYEELFKFLWNTATSTPRNLEQAFTFNDPNAITGPDQMSKIANTGVQGVKGIKELKKIFKELQ